MGQKNGVTFSSFRDLGEERIARLARRGFDRHLLFRSERAHGRSARLKIDAPISCRACAPLARPRIRPALRLPCNFSAIAFGEISNESCIGVARSAAQVMIQMADDQVSVTQIDQLIEQRDRIASTGNPDEITRFRWEVAAQARADFQWFHE